MPVHRTIASLLCFGVAIALPRSAMADDSRGLREFLEANHCQVLSRLHQIYTTVRKPRKPQLKNRYLTLSPVSSAHQYVQCIFIEGETRMYCEAASGLFWARQGGNELDVISATGRATLVRQGFELRPNGNFQRYFATPTSSDLSAVADMMLVALHGAYRLRADSKVDFAAPLAPDDSAHDRKCRPAS
jgi:hypothetical protein